uniref:Uncharacterized protein n=1 Tax=Hordeum vulgare subsp. vulgare TaxID=112509 RepID=A0A8I7BC40_HORVV
MLHPLDPARRPRESRSTTVPSPAVDQAVFFLRSHAVTLSAADGVNATSPMVVGKALEAQLSVPVHSLRVTAHHPEHFFVIFTQPAHQVNAVRRGSIRVDGASFNIVPWHEHDHATFDSLLLHVRVIIEKVSTHFWSVEGRRRSSAGGCASTASAAGPSSGVTPRPSPARSGRETSPTFLQRTLWGCFLAVPGGWKRWRGSLPPPPHRRVAPPPASVEYSMLIHVNRVEDWTPPSPRSAHSGQSGLPSSGSDDDTTPFPVVAPTSWTMGVEDSQRTDRLHRLARAPIANLGCHGAPPGTRSRDHDGDGGPGGGGHMSWKDVLLRRGSSQAPPRTAPSQRRRSRSPPARAIPTPPTFAGETGSDAAAIQVGSVTKGNLGGKDPVEDFFRMAKRPSIASVIVYGMAADVHNVAEAAVAAPLEFDEAPLLHGSVDVVQLDAFSPTLSAAASDLGQFSRATPSSAHTMEVQLGAVTGRVIQLEIGEAIARPESRGLFRAAKQPLISATPSRRPAAPPKSRATFTPTCSSARQAANVTTVPVAQRASLRLVKELGLLGPRDKMTEDLARALLHRFDEPLSDSDISVIARLTRLDSEALRVMARMAGPDGAADKAAV